MGIRLSVYLVQNQAPGEKKKSGIIVYIGTIKFGYGFRSKAFKMRSFRLGPSSFSSKIVNPNLIGNLAYNTHK